MKNLTVLDEGVPIGRLIDWHGVCYISNLETLMVLPRKMSGKKEKLIGKLSRLVTHY
jgi:hypothetical protein